MEAGGINKYCEMEANSDENPNDNILSTWDLYKNELSGENDPSGAQRYFMAHSHGTLNRTIQSASKENSKPAAVTVDLVTPPSTPSRSEKILKRTAPDNILSANRNSNLKRDGNHFNSGAGRNLSRHPSISDLDFHDSMDINPPGADDNCKKDGNNFNSGAGRNLSRHPSIGDMDFDDSLDINPPVANDNEKTVENSENQGAGEIPTVASHSDQEFDPANLLYHSSDAYFDSSDGDDVSKPWFLTNNKLDVMRVLAYYPPNPHQISRGKLECIPEILNSGSNEKCLSTQRNAPLIIFQNQTYRPHEENRKGGITARCTFLHDARKVCPGSIHIEKKDGTVTIHKECDHGSRRSEIAIQLVMRKLAIVLIISDTSKNNIYSLATKEAEKYDVGHLLKTNEQISRKLDSMLHRRSTNCFPPSLDQSYFVGARRIIDSSGTFDKDDDIIIGWRVDGLDEYFRTETINLDGKYSEVPNNYRQVYAITTRNNESDSTIPLIFSLLQNAKTDTYTKLFFAAKVEGLEPKFIYSDFEAAAIRAAETVWPNAKLFGCHRHWKVALLKNLQKHIGYEEAKSTLFQRLLKSLYTLAFAPKEKINLWFRLLRTRTKNTHSKINDFFVYLEKTYFGVNPRYSSDFWNCRERAMSGKDFTNNPSEQAFSQYQRLFHQNDYAQIKTTIKKSIEWTQSIIRDAKLQRNTQNRAGRNIPLYKNTVFLRAVMFNYGDFDSFSEKIFPWMEIPKAFH